MPPHKRRNEFVLLVDLASDERFIRNTLDKLFVHKSLEQKGINKYDSNDLYRMILLNYPHPDTDNKHFLLVGEDAQVMTDNSIFKSLDEHLETYQNCDTQSNCSWLKAIDYAGTIINGLTQDPSIQTFYLVLISDFKKMPDESNTLNQMQSLDSLRQSDVTFIAVINQDIRYEVSSPVESSEDAGQVMKGIEIPETNDQIEKLCLLASTIDGVISSPKYFLDFVIAFEVPSQKQEWRTELTLGDYAFPTITRKIIESCGNGLKKDPPGKETYEYYKMKEIDIEADVDLDVLDNFGDRVDDGDVVEVSLYHGQPVVIPEDVKKSFKTPGAAAFKIMGFIDKSQLSELYFGGEETLLVTADEKNERAIHFHEFVKVVHEENMYVLVVRVYNAGTGGRLFVLCPRPEGYFIMSDMCEEVHSVVKVTPVKETVDEGKLSSGMLALRQHLLRQGASGASLFHSGATLGLSQKAIIDKVRRLIGYNTESYEPEDLVQVYDIEEVKALFQRNVNGEQGVGKMEEGNKDIKDEDTDEEDW